LPNATVCNENASKCFWKPDLSLLKHSPRPVATATRQRIERGRERERNGGGKEKGREGIKGNFLPPKKWAWLPVTWLLTG